MVDLLERFGTACGEWCQRTGENERFITGPVMVFLGAMKLNREVAREGVDPETPDDEWKRFYTVDQMLLFIREVSERAEILDSFLIIGAVKMTDAILTSDVERYGAEKEHFRKSQAEYRDADYMASVGIPMEAARILHDDLDRLTVGSLEELKQRRERMLAWRAVYPNIFDGTRFSYL